MPHVKDKPEIRTGAPAGQAPGLLNSRVRQLSRPLRLDCRHKKSPNQYGRSVRADRCVQQDSLSSRDSGQPWAAKRVIGVYRHASRRASHDADVHTGGKHLKGTAMNAIVKAAAVQISPVLYSRQGTIEKVMRTIRELGKQASSSPLSLRLSFPITRPFHSSRPHP